MHNPAVFLLLALVVWIIADLVRHPFLACPKCHGERTLKAKIWPGRYRPCPRCDRSGEIKRGAKWR